MDRGYKFLFSFHKLFQQLLQDHINLYWVNLLDFSQIQQVNKTFVLEDFQKHEADILYKVALKSVPEKPVYLYILLEHQSSVDFSIPFRLVVYLIDIWRDFYRNADKELRTQKSFRLPPVFPIVLYNGKEPWTVSPSLKGIVEQGELFGDFLPDFRYHLVHISEIPETYLKELHNSLSAVFLLEKENRGEAFQEVLKVALSWVFKEKSEQVRNGILDWILIRFQKETQDTPLEELFQEMASQSKTPKEIQTMLDLMPKKLVELGRMKGHQEGRQEGRQEGLKTSLEIILKAKFGDIPDSLAIELKKINDENKLEKLLEEAGKAKTLKDFKKKLSPKS
jgi:predicted transposase YdaD